MYDTLISPDQLAAALQSPTPLLVLDCSFELTNHGAGAKAYAEGHVPGALYLHLEEALSAPKTGLNGRHPLPTREDFAGTLAGMGLNNGMQVVAYDNAGGMYAARLWWMLRWAGHGAVAVLDGGWAAWKAAGLPVSQETTAPLPPGRFTLQAPLVSMLAYPEVKANLETQQYLVLDARAPDRFRGENETMDPVGGHIPGAQNRLFKDNLGADGRFKPADQLHREFSAILGSRPPSGVVNQCGSGVTACHNLLAMEVAGLKGAALYPGSWSEWCAQPGSPIATGVA